MRCVLEEKAKVPVNEGTVVLREKQKRRVVMQVDMIGVPGDVTVVNIDKIGELSGIRGEFKSRCDYLILFQKANADVAVFVELKKTIAEGSKGLRQLHRSPPYLQYLRTVCSIHCENKVQPSASVTMRYLLIGEKVSPRLSKQRIRLPHVLPPEGYHDIAVNRMVGNRLHFDSLLQLAPG